MPPKEQNDTPQPVTIDQLLAVVREMVQANAFDMNAVREVASKATSDAYDRLQGTGWDVSKYPGRSVFNPRGDREQPRGELLGEVFWVGHLLQKDELTPEEIALVNAIEPGVYHGGQWVVRDLQPGVVNKAHRKLLVVFPCTDPDIRASLPSMAEMLREMTNAPSIVAA